MTESGKSRRARERLGLQLPARVRCRETSVLEWVEVTRLLDVTPFGARFTVSRPTEEGRLLHLSMPLPRPLRVYDFTEDQYQTYALVRRVRPVAAGNKEKIDVMRFEVGAAFIGKSVPESYVRDPATRYEVVPGDSGIWRAERKETLRRYVPPRSRTPDDRRRRVPELPGVSGRPSANSARKRRGAAGGPVGSPVQSALRVHYPYPQQLCQLRRSVHGVGH